LFCSTFSGNLKMRSQPKGVEAKITEAELKIGANFHGQLSKKTSNEGLRVS
jgi:hypothetical protein